MVGNTNPIEEMADLLSRDFEAINRLRSNILTGISKTTGRRVLPLADVLPFRAGLLELDHFAKGAQEELRKVLRQLGREFRIPD